MGKTKLAFGITGSFCNHQEVLTMLKRLIKEYDITAVVTDSVLHMDTRYGVAEDFLEQLYQLTRKTIITTIQEAELFVMNSDIKAMVIAPMTATTLGKFSHGIYDNAVLMGAKGMLRNHKPVILGVSTNDGLGISGENIMKMLATKDIYMIPFRQDDYNHKPNSLVCDWDSCDIAIADALKGKQIQPVLLAPVGK